MAGRASRRGPKTAAEAAAFAAAAEFPRQALHAYILGFQHPTLHKTLRFESPWPADFAALVADLRALNNETVILTDAEGLYFPIQSVEHIIQALPEGCAMLATVICGRLAGFTLRSTFERDRSTRAYRNGVKSMSGRGLPALQGEGGLSRYLSDIRKFPLLAPEEEYMFAKRWREHEDPEAARRLVTSHLRLVAKIAMGYRGYGLPVSEIISEGNVGLMQAVKRFEPDKGFRLATYAMWWIRAAIQEYILRSWSLVKLGTTANQKKLFFNLRKAKNKIHAIEEGDLTPEHLTDIADKLGVPEAEVTT